MNELTALLEAINKNLEETKARLDHIEKVLEVVLSRTWTITPPPRPRGL